MNTLEKPQNILIAEGATGTVLEKLITEQAEQDSTRAGEATPHREQSISAYKLLTAPLEHPDIIRELHKRYIASGADIIKTATFSANLIDIQKISPHRQRHAINETFCYDLNRRAAELSLSCAKILSDRPNAHSQFQFPKIIRTAGSIGPGTVLLSLGNAKPDEIYRAYKPQIYGLIEGGVDILLIETVQDILHAKTLLSLASEAQSVCKKSIAIIVSATLTSNGTLLCGTELEAFAEIIAPYEPLAIGINCSGGPIELEPFIKKLSQCTEIPISLMPNAGLPVIQNGKTVWPMDPESWAARMLTIINDAGIAIAGGCCGTTPEHIAALSKFIKNNRQQTASKTKVETTSESMSKSHSTTRLVSLYTVQSAQDEPLIIDERANTQGSKAFKGLILQNKSLLAGNYILTLAENESNAIDLAISLPGKDEIELYKTIIKQVCSKIKQAIVIDSMSEAVFKEALPLIPGKALINSINLENKARTQRLLALAKQYGASVVLLAMDKNGPAKTTQEKIAISEQLYEHAQQAGLRDSDILFDTCTFPIIAAGPDSAQATLDAIKILQQRHPKCGFILGIGNVSYGLARKLREPVTCYFYTQAVKAGLTAAIINPKIAHRTLNDYEILLLSNFFHKPDAQSLLEYYGTESTAALSQDEEPLEGQTLNLHTLIIKGKLHKLHEEHFQDEVQKLTEQEKITIVLTAMQEIAQQFDSGKISLPEVMLAAETARAILAGNAKNVTGEHLSTIVLATVKGDLHDIGKNIVRLILEASNIKVIDLGIDIDANKIVTEALHSNADAVGVSGLLTRSLAEMQEVARVLREQKSSAILICGGAAVSSDYVAKHIEPLFPGKVFFGKDPFEALKLLKNIANSTAVVQHKSILTSPVPEHFNTATHNESQQLSQMLSRSERSTSPAGTRHDAYENESSISSGTIPLYKLLELLNFKRLIHVRLKYSNFAEGFKQIQKVLALFEDATVKLAYKSCVCPCYSKSTQIIKFTAGEKTIEFPVSVSQNCMSITRYFQNTGGMFCCTLGRESAELVHSIANHSMSDGVTLHALFAELTETGAELVHNKLKTAVQVQGGKRYSFGFPGAPGVEYNRKLLEFLSAETIGLSALPSGELIPEYSITAIVSFDPDARYIDAQ